MFKITLTKKQWERISEISSNLGLLILASFVIPFSTDEFNIFIVILGLIITVILWYGSIKIAQKY